jgi:hypothetical protein
VYVHAGHGFSGLSDIILIGCNKHPLNRNNMKRLFDIVGERINEVHKGDGRTYWFEGVQIQENPEGGFTCTLLWGS